MAGWVSLSGREIRRLILSGNEGLTKNAVRTRFNTKQHIFEQPQESGCGICPLIEWGAGVRLVTVEVSLAGKHIQGERGSNPAEDVLAESQDDDHHRRRGARPYHSHRPGGTRQPGGHINPAVPNFAVFCFVCNAFEFHCESCLLFNSVIVSIMFHYFFID